MDANRFKEVARQTELRKCLGKIYTGLVMREWVCSGLSSHSGSSTL
jgi:hypothetical protein